MIVNDVIEKLDQARDLLHFLGSKDADATGYIQIPEVKADAIGKFLEDYIDYLINLKVVK